MANSLNACGAITGEASPPGSCIEVVQSPCRALEKSGSTLWNLELRESKTALQRA